MAACREAGREKAPEAEPLLLEGAVQGRRHAQPLIPPAADLYPSPRQEPHHDPHHDDVSLFRLATP